MENLGHKNALAEFALPNVCDSLAAERLLPKDHLKQNLLPEQRLKSARIRRLAAEAVKSAMTQSPLYRTRFRQQT
ncbi:MAG TPA: hypothetical protein VFZ08_06155, partial [Terriglobia bacterium]|nr:hypothetical protein [Terriglobia bacterium]